MTCYHFPLQYQVLLIFSFFTMNNGFSWFMFAPVEEELEGLFHGLTSNQLELLNSWQPCLFVIASIPIMHLVVRDDGLRRTVCLATAFEVAGASFKFTAVLMHSHSFSLYLLHLGQILSGIGGPVATGSVSALSAQWFAPGERTRATGAAVLSNSVGNSISFLLVPFLTRIDFMVVVVYEVLMGVIALCVVWRLFPPQKRSPYYHLTIPVVHQVESLGMSSIKPSTTQQLVKLISHPSVVLLLMTYSWTSGGYSAWTSLFDTMFQDFYSTEYIGIISFSGMISYVIGGLVSAYLTDLYFNTKMKRVICVCIAGNVFFSWIFNLSVPRDVKHKPLLNFGEGWVLMISSLCGFCNGSAAPVLYELVAEISYPVEEGISGIAVSMCENMGALFFYQIVAGILEERYLSLAFAVGMLVTFGLASQVHEEYKRRVANRVQQECVRRCRNEDDEELDLASSTEVLQMSQSTETPNLLEKADHFFSMAEKDPNATPFGLSQTLDRDEPHSS